MSEIFNSKLAPYMTGLVDQKHALGYKYNEQVKLLRKFDAFCLEHFPDESTITRDMLDIWGAKRSYEHPGTLRNRVTVVSHLAVYMAINEQIWMVAQKEKCFSML